MTARELAKILLKNPDDIVCVTSSNFEQNHADKVARGVYRFDGTIEKRQFRDAFDGEPYSSEVISSLPNLGKTTTQFVKITCL